MEFECEPQLEYQEFMLYVKTLHNNNELCIVCQVDETVDAHKWDRYMTRCGHVSHTRCFRRWCGKKVCLNCPLCGDIPETEANLYCSHCDVSVTTIGTAESLQKQRLQTDAHDEALCNKQTRRSALPDEPLGEIVVLMTELDVSKRSDQHVVPTQ